MLKALFGLPLRQATGLVASLLKLAELNWPVPDFRKGSWSTRRHGASRPRQWCKLHLDIDAETLEVRAIEGEQANATGQREPANGSRVGDGPMLPKLLEQIPAEEPIGTVTADGAYDTRACHAAIAAGEATAVIATRRNGRPWRETTPRAQARNEILRAGRRFGRAI